MNRAIAFVGLFLLVTGLANADPAEKTLTRLRSLVGDWEGTFEWTGGRTGSGKSRAVYHLTGNGSAVIEDLYMGDQTAPSMTSVYHLDGADLRMTHYCAAQNQPRLKADRIEDDIVTFTFIDATNLSKQPAHVEAVELRFPADDRLVVRFTFTGAKKSIEHIELKRVVR